MHIIEQTIVGKHNAETCEDQIVVTDNFIAVIDGSTSKSKLPPMTMAQGRTRGQVAADTVAKVIRDADPLFDAWTLCHHATEMLRMIYRMEYGTAVSAAFAGKDIISYLAEHPEDRCACSAIVYSRCRNEVWLIGDCHGLIIEDENDRGVWMRNEKPYEKRLARLRAEYLQQHLDDGSLTIDDVRHHDTGRDQIIFSMLAEMRRGQNKTYAVIDGFDVPMAHVETYGNFSTEQIILASDGYPQLRPTLAKTEAYLQRCLQRDPLLIHTVKATKAWMHGNVSFDDRAYIRFIR